jgi:hypothetical protein
MTNKKIKKEKRTKQKLPFLPSLSNVFNDSIPMIKDTFNTYYTIKIMYKNCNYNKESLIKILEKYIGIESHMYLLNLIINAYSNIQKIESYLKKEQIVYNIIKIVDNQDYIINNASNIMYLSQLIDTEMLKFLIIFPGLMKNINNNPMYAFDKFILIKNNKLVELEYALPLISIKNIFENGYIYECNICFENITKSIFCKCSYAFCIECFKKLKECPICKKNLH